MSITAIYNPSVMGRPMRVAGFLSGSGTNLMKLIEHENRLNSEVGKAPFEVAFIFSDRSDGLCAGEKIAYSQGLPYFSYDIRVFHKIKGTTRNVNNQEGLATRKAYDSLAKKLVDAFNIDVIALGGYMSYITLKGCVNVHPADLSIRAADGRRKYIGKNAVRDAILSGESVLRASTLWTDEGVDTGPLLMVSEPLKVRLPAPFEALTRDKDRFTQLIDDHQERLKAVGDWKIFPKTIEFIARGRFSLDSDKRVYFDGRPVPEGVRL
jgi:folate-dependent phosphoribosylglycinamide formyltransferase PurN